MGAYRLEPEYAHVFYLATEIEPRLTEAAELLIWSKREDRPLLAMGPKAAEELVLAVFDMWPTAAELMAVRSGEYRAKMEAQAAEKAKRKPVGSKSPKK